MYGVLYAVSPELFPTKDRGTGNAIVAISNRIFGIMVRPVPSPFRFLILERLEFVTDATAGPDHCAVLEPADGSAHLRRGGALHRRGSHRNAPTLRTTGQGVNIEPLYLEVLDDIEQRRECSMENFPVILDSTVP